MPRVFGMATQLAPTPKLGSLIFRKPHYPNSTLSLSSLTQRHHAIHDLCIQQGVISEHCGISCKRLHHYHTCSTSELVPHFLDPVFSCFFALITSMSDRPLFQRLMSPPNFLIWDRVNLLPHCRSDRARNPIFSQISSISGAVQVGAWAPLVM